MTESGSGRPSGEVRVEFSSQVEFFLLETDLSKRDPQQQKIVYLIEWEKEDMLFFSLDTTHYFLWASICESSFEKCLEIKTKGGELEIWLFLFSTPSRISSSFITY